MVLGLGLQLLKLPQVFSGVSEPLANSLRREILSRGICKGENRLSQEKKKLNSLRGPMNALSIRERPNRDVLFANRGDVFFLHGWQVISLPFYFVGTDYSQHDCPFPPI